MVELTQADVERIRDYSRHGNSVYVRDIQPLIAAAALAVEYRPLIDAARAYRAALEEKERLLLTDWHHDLTLNEQVWDARIAVDRAYDAIGQAASDVMQAAR